MSLVVQKFGGTSVEGPERLKAVARRLVAAHDAGNDVVGVLSAMGGATDALIALAHELSPAPHPRELDMLLSVGERISCALAAMAIHDLGRTAISLTGSQAGVVTDTDHTRAKVLEIRPQRVHDALAQGAIVLVAGFQGVSTEFEVTTLGRGGSDTTAVALAAALGADVCEIYTDVEGVFAADPRVVPHARKLDAVSYEEMLELAASGAKVLMLRSVEYARKHGVRIHVRSSLSENEGTWVVSQEELMEQPIISGIAHDTSEAEVTILGVPDRPGIAARVFRTLADVGVNVDMIVQNVSAEGHTDISFTLPKSEMRRAVEVLEPLAAEIEARGLAHDPEIAKISLVGAGMRTHPGIAADMFDALAEAGINIGIISTSPVRISCVVPAAQVERAVRAVYECFELNEPAVTADA
jgi:aspartate kinase